MLDQPTSDQQPTSDDVTKTPIQLATEGDDLYENRKFKAAAEKYQKVVNMGYFNTSDESTNNASIHALYKLANMIYHNKNSINSDGYPCADAEKLYDMLYKYDTKGILLPYKKYRRIKEHYESMPDIHKVKVSGKSGGYKKRKSNRKHPSKRTRTRKHKWSLKYKRSIDCKHPKGFSQRQHCKYGRKNMRKLTRKK